MKLKSKILIIIAVFSFCLYLGGGALIGITFINFIRHQEQAQIRNDGGNLWQYMQSEIERQQSVITDWANWDETYSYVETGSSAYADANLSVQTLNGVNLDFMALFDDRGNVVTSICREIGANEIADCPPALLSAIGGGIRSENVGGAVSRYLCGGYGNYCITEAPVTDSQMKKPPNGVLVIGKSIDAGALAEMQAIAGGTVRIGALYDLDEGLFRQIAQQPAQAGSPQIFSVSESISGMVTYVVPPVSGMGSPLVIEFAKQRTMFIEGLKQLALALSLFLALIAAVLLMLIRCLNRHITKPLAGLMRSVAGIQLSKEKIDRLPVNGADEIATLSGTVNSMIDKIEQGYENILQFGCLVTKMKQGLAVFDAVAGPSGGMMQYRPAYSNESFEKIIGPENMGSALDILTQRDARRLEKLNGVVATGSSIVYEVYAKDLEKSFEIVAYRPKPMQFAAIVTDITERKLIESERQYVSYHDQLTGLYNRRYFDEALVGFDTPKHLPLSVIIGDLNGLKLTNDAFGHRTGDALLVAVAEALTSVCRKQDVIARWGGDEFIVLLPRTSQKEAGFVCERINKAVARIEINALIYSISLGYETKTKPEEKFDEVMKKAEDYMYRKKIIASHSGRGQAINAMLTSFKENNPRERDHSNRVSRLCREIGQAMAFTEEQLNDLEILGLVHDIGKIAISDTIINKGTRLTEREWAELRRHPEIGYRILCSAANMQEIAGYVLYHHERWDGTGYPKAVKGRDIPIQSRILAVADAFDAMTSERPYRKPMGVDAAVDEIRRMAGVQFDPKIARVFVEDVLGRKWEKEVEKTG
jgi:diguanylate cyclase (GGDEF)-like protein